MDRLRWSLEDRLILELCRRAPDRQSVLRAVQQPSIDWLYFIRTARRHRVAPLVLDKLLKLPMPPDFKGLLQAVGKREIVSVLHDNAVFKSELTRLLTELRDQDIDCILLKGLSLNFTHLRSMGDIDLLVPPARLVKAIDVILTIDGYRYRRMDPDGPDPARSYEHRLPERERRQVQAHLSWNNEFQLHNPATGVLVELHHTPLQIRNPDGRFMENIDGMLEITSLFWEHRRYDAEVGCHVLAAPHSLLLMCLRNAIKHSPAKDTFRLSNLVDIDYLVAGGIPWRQLLSDSARMRAAPFLLFSLLLARSLLATPVPVSVLRELKADCTPRQLQAISIHRRCVSSLRSSSILYSKLYRINSPWAFGGTVAQRLSWLFLLPIWIPSIPQMVIFFGLRRDSPWLTLAYLVNPVRWMIRVLQKVFIR